MSLGYRCDGPECSRWAGERSHMHNWYEVTKGMDHHQHASQVYQFCSKECLVRWIHS